MEQSNIEHVELDIDDLNDVIGGSGDCYYGGQRYSNGAKLDNGQTCTNGQWV